jgi:hypothetical protein
LLKIDDTQVNRARELPLTLTPADETQALRDVRATALLNDGMVLHGLGITPDRDTVRYVLLTDAGSEVTLEYYGEVSSSAGPPLPTSLKQDGCVLWLTQHSNQEAREMVLPNSRWVTPLLRTVLSIRARRRKPDPLRSKDRRNLGGFSGGTRSGNGLGASHHFRCQK